MNVRSATFYGTLTAISLPFFLLYILGTLHYVTVHEENTCNMTFMFEYSQYVRITLNKKVENQFPKFSLYSYAEGFVTERHRRMHFSGIPVLFVPGNAGSFKQVRSLASVALRISINEWTPYHFDFFTVDLAEDYSALYGGVLMEKTLYISHCIQRILAIYNGKIKNIIIIGHSMGGIVAKGSVLLTDNSHPGQVNMLITLAAPHVPLLMIDGTLDEYYRNLKNVSHRLKESGTTIISISGGSKDMLVTASQAIDPIADINIVTTNIANVWTSVDHLCILWCKQLMMSIVRALFDCVDSTKPPAQIIADSEERLKVMSYHLLRSSMGKKYSNFKATVELYGGVWIENIRRQYVWSAKKYMADKSRNHEVYLMIRILNPWNRLTIETFSLDSSEWLFTCSAFSVEGNSRICKWGWNLTNFTRSSPDILRHRKRKVVDLNLNEINRPSVTHVVIRVPRRSLQQNAIIHVDSYSNNQRNIQLNEKIPFLGRFFGLSKFDPIKFHRGNVRYYVAIPNILDSVSIKLEDIECEDDFTDIHHAMIELLEPWNPDIGQFKFFTDRDNGPKVMRLQTAHKMSNVTPILRMTLDPMCSYTFDIQRSGLIERVLCLVRDRWPILYTVIVSLLILAIGIRVDHGQKGVKITTVTMIFGVYLGIGLEMAVAWTVLFVLTTATCVAVILFGSVAHSVAIRFLARTITFSMTWSDWILGGLNQLPLVTTVLLLSLIPATCGALAMLISVFLYFLKLTNMYEDYLEQLFMASLRHFNILPRSKSGSNDQNNSSSAKEQIINQLVLFLTWCFAALPAIPSVLIWAKNFRYEKRLTSENPVLLTCWVVMTTCGTLGILRIPSSLDGIRSRTLATILYCLSLFILSTTNSENSTYYQQWMAPFIAVAIAIVTIDSIVPRNY
ncbi:GPI inositol-deacylase [Cephus cinctus]|uniref:GPI inositol-deacylase n=1 Tax=Cephus cinctus TaxID=211228 RepID=A0AAJ7W6K9_CEPCN|nr:GPI inositol-deacylase [Cephus cinctus]XP_015606893.1 GPI inositol-deacylase [Cephus cinctus]XP_024946414.1 GPI inositol-deacylase [Cephus cinctus]XP_024946415.1 GPI inositol-deacylase [Cephus cinctus]